jgi:hypothetical protein
MNESGCLYYNSGGTAMDLARRFLLVLTLSFAAAVAPAAAQVDAAHPDLTGVWNLDPGKSRVPGQPKGFTETVAISCSGPNVAMRFTSPGREFASTYIADGRTRLVDQAPQLHLMIKAYWKKSVLVIEQKPQPPINPISESETAGGMPALVLVPILTIDRWKLSSDGRTLGREVESRSSRIVFVYDKEP